MKKFFSLLALTFSFSTLASEQVVHFSYYGDMGTRSYYACSYVEDQAEKFLELLGAEGVRTSCFGGIDSGSWNRDFALTATFSNPEVTGSGTEVVEIRPDPFSTNCGLNTRMIKTFLKHMPQVKVLEKRDFCTHNNDRFYFKLEVSR